MKKRLLRAPAAGLIFNHMIEYQSRLDLVYHALADQTRRGMVKRLSRGTLTISELAEPLPMSLAAASKHVQTLERADLVRREKKGREYHITLNEAPLHAAADWASRTAAFWEQRLDQLEQYLNEEKNR